MIDQLRRRAKELGMAALGVAPAIDEVLQSFTWAKSVIVGAMSYYPPEQKVEFDASHGLVARIARRADYHNVLRGKLGDICANILLEVPNARTQICVDTCPLPERKLAVLAGVAWRGKSGNVYANGCGSYVAIGEIITDLQIPISEPIDIDRCGSCDRCIRACPTSAISEPYTVDKSRCLSALTQCSGSIALEFRKAIGNRIYGCDICQEVCPQNARVRPQSPEFASDVFPGANPELIPLIDLSPSDFRNNVKNSSIGWIRRTRIRRNAAIAAGNNKCEAAVPALARMLDDENPMLRGTAAWALGEIGSASARNALESARIREESEEIAAALSKIKDNGG